MGTLQARKARDAWLDHRLGVLDNSKLISELETNYDYYIKRRPKLKTLINRKISKLISKPNK